MKKYFTKVLIGIIPALFIVSAVVSAQSSTSFTPTILPLADSTYDIGTSSNAYRDLYVDQLCLTGDTCYTSIVGGGSGSTGLATTSPWTTGDLVQVSDNGTVNSLATSSLGITGSDISINNSTFGVLTGTDAQTLWSQNDAALLNARATGIRYGGDLTDLGSGVVRIAAGAGQILNTSNPESPTYTAVTWSQSDIDLSGASDGVQNFIYVDNTNTVKSTTTQPSHEEYRQYIWLHRVVVRSGAVTGTLPVVQPVQQYTGALWDIWDAIGILKHENEFILTGDGSGGIDISAGGLYNNGANFYTNPESPAEVEFSTQNSATFRLVLRDNTQSADLTTVDTTNYDNGGSLTEMTNNRWGIYEIFMFPNGNIRILRPQTQYISFIAANEALYLGQYTPVTPSNFDDAFRLGWILFEKGDTTLSNADFVTSNKFGGIGGAIATVGVGYLAAVNNLSDLDDTATARTNLGLGTSDSPTFSGITVTNASTTNLTVSGYFDFLGTVITNVSTWFSGLFDTNFATKDTDDLTEGTTNLYSQWNNSAGSSIYYETGNVGIATTSPEARLDIWGASSGKILTLFSNTGTKFMEMLNTGVTTLLGAWDFGGADSLEIPNGSNPTTNTAGEIALDTDVDALKVATSTSAGYIPVYDISRAVYASSTWTSTSTALGSVTTPNFDERITTGTCYANGTGLIRATDGTNATNAVSLSSGTTTVTFTTNNQFNKGGERWYYEIGTPSSLSLVQCSFELIYER